MYIYIYPLYTNHQTIRKNDMNTTSQWATMYQGNILMLKKNKINYDAEKK